jgi:hypothetical protein
MADTRDLITLAEAKRSLRITPHDVVDDDELAVYITAASRVLDEHFGYTVALAVTNEAHDGINASGYGMRTRIIVSRRPVLSWSSIVEYSATTATTLTAESAGTQPASGYHAERYEPNRALYSGIVVRRTGGVDTSFPVGRGNVLFAYTAGRVSSTTAVEARFKRACGMVLGNLWREREPGTELQGEYLVPASSFPGFTIPNAARQLLINEWGQHSPVSGGPS